MENKVQSHCVVCSLCWSRTRQAIHILLVRTTAQPWLPCVKTPATVIRRDKVLEFESLQAAVLFTSKQFGLCCRSRFQKPTARGLAPPFTGKRTQLSLLSCPPLRSLDEFPLT